MTTWFVPGRIEVFGKHTDYCGGNVLVAAVDRGITVSANKAAAFHAVSEHGDAVELDPAVPSPLPAGHWGRYVHTVLRRLAADFGELQPVSINVTSNLPLASGMSSSSALLIGVAMAVADLHGFPESEAWRAVIRDDVELAAYLATVENGSSYKHLRGGGGVGTNGGSEDHAAILCSQPGKLLNFSFNPMALLDTVALPDEAQFVVATSGVTAEKSGAALADYNRCSAEARRIVELANQSADAEHRSLAEALNGLGANRLFEVIEREPNLVARLQHFLVESDQVVPAAIGAFRTGHAARLGAVAQKSQAAATELLRNQVPETSQLVRSALEQGACASTSFGAGFGGSVWAMVNAADAQDFATRWIKDYRSHYPEAGVRARAVAVNPSQPAHRVD